MPTLEQFKKLTWYKEKPSEIKKLICLFPYASTVRIKETDQFAYIYSWFENGTMRVVITEEDNPHLINARPGTYSVFGYKPEQLEFIKENPDLVVEEGDC